MDLFKFKIPDPFLITNEPMIVIAEDTHLSGHIGNSVCADLL